MKFRKDRPEEACSKVVKDVWSERYSKEGGLICLRIAGHQGECVSLMCDAAIADDVCHECRNPLTGPHEKGCQSGCPHERVDHNGECLDCDAPVWLRKGRTT